MFISNCFHLFFFDFLFPRPTKKLNKFFPPLQIITHIEKIQEDIEKISRRYREDSQLNFDINKNVNKRNRRVAMYAAWPNKFLKLPNQSLSMRFMLISQWFSSRCRSSCLSIWRRASWSFSISFSRSSHSTSSISSIMRLRLSCWAMSARGGRVASQARLARALSIISTSARPAGRPQP